MTIFYKRLLSIGIAIGVFCSLVVFTAGQTQWTTMLLKNKILESDLCKIVKMRDASYVCSMGIEEANKLRSILPEDCISDLNTHSLHYDITYEDEPLSGNVVGTGSNYTLLMNMKIIQGRYLSQEDVDEYRKVCVLKSSFFDLVRTRNATHIDIKGEAYEIVGVVTEEESSKAINSGEGDIFIPFTTMCKYDDPAVDESYLIYQIIFNKGGYTKEQITDRMKTKADTLGVDISDLKLMPYHYDEFMNINAFNKTFFTVFIISLLILIIAAFNIIYIATASIIDREREIGLKTALGASSRHIIMQVSREILVCALRGGIAGTAIASIINTTTNLGLHRYSLSFNAITIAAGILLATIAGLLTSIIPAKKAAKLDPVAALREE